MRIHTRYLVEIVEQFNICPFAQGARTTAALERRVILDEDPIAAALGAIDELKPRDQVAVAILIFPRAPGGVDAFEAFLNQLRAADDARRGERGPFAFALFHPEARFGLDTPDRLVMFFRRSPDPSIQLVRFSALDAVRSPAPGGKFLFDFTPEGYAELARRAQSVPVSERIGRDNFATMERVGQERFERVFRDILNDRARSYAKLDLG